MLYWITLSEYFLFAHDWGWSEDTAAFLIHISDRLRSSLKKHCLHPHERYMFSSAASGQELEDTPLLAFDVVTDLHDLPFLPKEGRADELLLPYTRISTFIP